MKKLLQPLFALPVLLILVACNAGNGEGLNEQGRPNAETPVLELPNNPSEPPVTDPNKISANLTSIQEHVFTPICSSCHGGANPAAGQDLSTIKNSITHLINVQSSNPLFKRVAPGLPTQSYLYLKITGNSQAGARMPLGQAPLSEEAITAIKDWISQGAIVPDDIITPTQVNRVKITRKAVSHNNKQQIEITLTFNQAINFSMLTNEQILVSQYQNKQLVPLTNHITFKVINAHQFIITLMASAVQTTKTKQQQFNLQLNNPNLSTITSISGQMLDGNNDGIDGGVFSYDFLL